MHQETHPDASYPHGQCRNHQVLSLPKSLLDTEHKRILKPQHFMDELVLFRSQDVLN